MCRHVVPPALIALALAPWSQRLESVWHGRDRRRTTWVVVGCVVAAGPGLLAVIPNVFCGSQNACQALGSLALIR